MSIGIGLHCWYCNHGPCNNECTKQQNKKQKEMKKNSIGLLNYEGDVFKVIKDGLLFNIVDFTGSIQFLNIQASKVMDIYDGKIEIFDSNNKIYDLSKHHQDAKPERNVLMKFLNYKESNNNLTISFTLSDTEQQLFDDWKEAIKKIYGEYGHFEWTISPTGVGNGIEVWSSLAKTSIDLTDMDNW